MERSPGALWRADIRDRDGFSRGGGVLIDDRHILTCAHVVADALGIPRDAREAAGEVSVWFPTSQTERPVPAEVLPQCWVPAADRVSGADVALLRLARDRPRDTHYASLARWYDLGFAISELRVFGPVDTGSRRFHEWESLRALGTGGPRAELVQLRATGPRPLGGGTSGSGLMAVVGSASPVIGFIVGGEPGVPDSSSWMIPMETAERYLPRLGDLLPPHGVPLDAWRELIRIFDGFPRMRKAADRDLLVGNLERAYPRMAALPRFAEADRDIRALLSGALRRPGGLVELHRLITGAPLEPERPGPPGSAEAALAGWIAAQALEPVLTVRRRAELYDTLAAAQAHRDEIDFRELYTRARGEFSDPPHTRTDDLITLARELEDANRSAEAGRPLFAFARLLTGELRRIRSPGPVADRLADWLAEAGPREPVLLPPAAPDDAPWYCVARLRRGGGDTGGYFSQISVQRAAEPPVPVFTAERPSPLDEVKRLFRHHYSEDAVARMPRGTYPVMEFFLPDDLLEEPVEHWPLQEHPFRMPLGRSFHVVVRAQDRLSVGMVRETFLPGKWRWFRERSARPDHLTVARLPSGRGEDADLLWLEAHVTGERSLACLAVAGTERPMRAVEIAVGAGLPVVLWLRTGAPDRGAAEAIDALLDGGDLAELPERLHRLRRAAWDADDHPGNHLTLLWCDADRLPLRPTG
ncbi:effector-associated domain 2-containing protein [Allonocardiopsis opalescens]|uniref:Trypsin-like peptidase n=1 Tax=Allonocardiopsis opalescens TaxID=1144618 RepID=A0A2T0QFL0_9ACTN|nr:trypsin-like peptidase domain-containing protein [Allonocardiopsis opalescens]PRY02702.1 trypsin-like peptidase [Allonocardiopsis opalescens]